MTPLNQPLPVLYAEDTEEDAFFMRRAFERSNFPHPLMVVPNGWEAIQHLNGLAVERAIKERGPRLIILDVKMPLADGIDVLKWVRQRSEFDAIPVVMFSSSSQEIDVNHARENGANAYLVKPSDLERLRQQVEELRALCASTEPLKGWLTLSGGIV